MSSDDAVGVNTNSFAERIWPVIDVHARVRRLVEAEDRRLAEVAVDVPYDAPYDVEPIAATA
jgi:hypothetical protein